MRNLLHLGSHATPTESESMGKISEKPGTRLTLRLFLSIGIAAGSLVPGTVQLRAQALELAEAHVGDDFTSAIERSRDLIREIMAAQGVPGASVAVGIGGEIVWSEGFGWANIELGVPVTTLTKFRIGSVSKTMTASALGLLVERGLLDLDAPVQTYVPDFPEKKWPISTRQLGGHIAGIRHYRGAEMLSSAYYPTVESGLEIFSADTLIFEPETAYSYSSYGWNLLSAVLESASGEDFLGFMRDEVFEPLGLRHTVPDHNDSIVVHRTEFYEAGAGGAIVNAPYVDNSYKWAGGGFLSTPEDLIRFGQSHMGPGFLKAGTLEVIQASQNLRNGESTDYGIGWRTGYQEDGDVTLGHSGGSVGGTTLLILVPEHDLVVAGVVNISGPAALIVNQVAQVFENHLEGGSD
jgi:serine beta-lactamase-like protein LACTB